MSRDTAYARSGSDRASLYDDITNKLLAELEAGRLPWVQPWGTGRGESATRPAGECRHWTWLLRRQCTDPLGRRLRAWFPRSVLAHLPPGFVARRPMCARASAAPPSSMPTALSPDDEKRRARDTGRRGPGDPVPEALYRLQYGAVRGIARRHCHLGAAAGAWSDRADGGGVDRGERDRPSASVAIAPSMWRRRITCRSRRRRPSSSRINWHRTALHECAHASGAPHRLNRDLSGSFGTKKYAFEELVAEISAAFCCAALGIVPTVRHADYIASWAEVPAPGQSRHRPRRVSGQQGGPISCSGFCRSAKSPLRHSGDAVDGTSQFAVA